MNDPRQAARESGRLHQALQRSHSRYILPWLGLAGILVAYILAVGWLHPTNFFGLTEDDSIYFSSARSLAQGQGYILPSVPNTPAAAKYPVLYPWLLSWIWRWDSSFPANLTRAVALNVCFGCGFLTAAFLFLRGLGDFRDCETLALTAFCGLHSTVLFHTANLVADIPFAAVSLAGIVVAGQALRADTNASTVASGILSGASILLRVLGAPVTAGICLAIFLQKGWRKSALFAAGTAPFFGAWLWRSMAVAPQAATDTAGVSGCSASWQMTWLYYTSYLGFWRSDVLQHHAIWPLLKGNLIFLFLQPGLFFVQLRLAHFVALGFVPAVVLSFVTFRGLLARSRERAWQPACFAFAVYLVPVLLWNYGAFERFLILFLPLFAALVWLEGKQVLGRIHVALPAQDRGSERIAAVFLCAIIAFLLLAIGWSFRGALLLVRQQSDFRGELLGEKREAYAWLREHAAERARVVAYEDAALYLYTGRQAIRPVIFSPAGAFRPGLLQADLACMTEAARATQATYWVVADDDFGFEWEPAATLGLKREHQFEGPLPRLFRSNAGHIRIYSLGCPKPEADSCLLGYPMLDRQYSDARTSSGSGH